jgi:hypothetical protein
LEQALKESDVAQGADATQRFIRVNEDSTQARSSGRNLKERNADLQKAATENVVVQAALHDEKERAQVTLNSIGDAGICTNVSGQVSHLNANAERLTVVESGGIALRLEWVDCRSVIHVVLAAHGERAMKHGALFRSPLEVADLKVLTDKRILERIVEHLVSHALEGRASVRIAGVRRSGKSQEFVDICISDQGPGLIVHAGDGKPVKARAAPPAPGVPDGLLRVSRRLAKLIAGRITQRFDPEQGRTFTLTLQASSEGGP